MKFQKLRWWGSRFLLIVLVPASTFAIALSADSGLWMRHFSLAIATLALVSIPVLVIIKHNEIVRSGPAHRQTMRRMKLLAEVFAGFALVAFLAAYFRFGLQADMSNFGARASLQTEVAASLEKVMRPALCASLPHRTACEDVTKELNVLFWSLMGQRENEVADAVAKIDRHLRFSFTGLNAAEQQQVDHARKELQQIRIKTEEMELLFTSIHLLSLLFAVIAVSSKIGIALWEYRGENVLEISFLGSGRSAKEREELVRDDGLSSDDSKRDDDRDVA